MSNFCRLQTYVVLLYLDSEANRWCTEKRIEALNREPCGTLHVISRADVSKFCI